MALNPPVPRPPKSDDDTLDDALLGELIDPLDDIEGNDDAPDAELEDESEVDEPPETILAARVIDGVDRLERWLLEQPFVTAVNTGPQQVSFSFTGDGIAQCDLLKRMIENGFPLLEFTGKTQSLEDAFMAITRGITQ